jgi:hypothetical protein
MPTQDWIELPIFIHGVTPDEYPGDHDPEYNTLYNQIQAALKQHGKAPFQELPLKIEWGWRDPNSADPASPNDSYLAEVERKVATQSFAMEAGTWDFTLNPERLLNKMLRKFILFGASDLIYYASADGEATIRSHVFSDIGKVIDGLLEDPDARVSITLVGHSAGSLIAHDLLYHLFGRGKESQYEEVRKVHALTETDNPRLRLRRFYTMGSPITPLIFRANSLITKIHDNDLLDPIDLGMRPEDGLSNPRWVNFWDKDDIASYPLNFLYKQNPDDKVVVDQYVNIGDFFPNVHNAYWSHALVAQGIASTF